MALAGGALAGWLVLDPLAAALMGVIAAFDGPVDRRMGAMLAFGNVNAAAYGAGNVGAKPLGTAP